MPAMRININPVIYDWILQNIDMDEQRADIREEFLFWKSGEKKPTFNQLEKFSRATNIPFGYFFLSTPPNEKMDLLEYRTIDSLKLVKPSRNLVDTVYEMQDIQDWMREYIENSDYTELQYVGSLKEVDDLYTIITKVRSDLELDKDWFCESSGARESFKILRDRLGNIGTLVMMNGVVGSNTHRTLDINEFRAFTLIDNYAPLIFINANDSHNGRLFSLVHEMTHIWLGENSFYNDYPKNINGVNKLETLCNAVAAEILVPLDLFNEKWSENRIDDVQEKVSDISRYFNCGTTVIARRALDQGAIDKAAYYEIVNIAINEYRVQRSGSGAGGNFYNTIKTRIDSRFLYALNKNIHEGKTSFTEAYRLTNTNRKTFPELVRRAAGSEI